jgi:hypothetical protein
VPEEQWRLERALRLDQFGGASGAAGADTP